MWQTNKPLVIAAIAGIVLMIAAAVFAVVFFTVIKPAGAVPATVQDKPTVQMTADTTDDSAEVSADTEDGNTLPDVSDDTA